MRKNHAIHNEKACDHLLKTGEFNDWVITTAFYSALHYVRSELFPLKDNGNTYEELDSYFYAMKRIRKSNLSKHKTIIQLVKINLKSASSHYRWLHDACMTTRYDDYRVSNKKAKVARKRLSDLKRQLKIKT